MARYGYSICWNYCVLVCVLFLTQFLKFSQCYVIEGPSNVTYLPGLTPLPIELTCNVTGLAAWRVNGTGYLPEELNFGALPGHNHTGTNILVNSPVNNTEYICLSLIRGNDTSSDPAYIIIAGVPEMVTGLHIAPDSVDINGTNVTLTLTWKEPFNNFDPIVNYTVSCSGDVACPPNFTTTDNTTRSTITNLTPKTSYTFSVAATNSIGSGEADVWKIFTAGIGKVTGVTLFCGPLGLINHCTVMWNSNTQDAIIMYQVHYSGITINVTSPITTLTFTAPSLPEGVFTGNVIVTVTAVNSVGLGPASDPATAEIRVASSVTNTSTTLISSNVTSELYNITVTCTIHPNSTANRCEVMAMVGSRVTRTGNASITNETATVTVNGLECGVTYTIIAGGILNGDLVGPRSSYESITTGPCPGDMTVDDESDAELSTGAVITISTVVTFIITLVVTALICIIITSLYYKYWYELKEKVQEDDDKNVNIRQMDPYGGKIAIDDNPAYSTTIKMDTDSIYY